MAVRCLLRAGTSRGSRMCREENLRPWPRVRKVRQDTCEAHTASVPLMRRTSKRMGVAGERYYFSMPTSSTMSFSTLWSCDHIGQVNKQKQCYSAGHSVPLPRRLGFAVRFGLSADIESRVAIGSESAAVVVNFLDLFVMHPPTGGRGGADPGGNPDVSAAFPLFRFVDPLTSANRPS